MLFAVPAEEQPQDDERDDEPADPEDEEPAETIQLLDEPRKFCPKKPVTKVSGRKIVASTVRRSTVWP